MRVLSGGLRIGGGNLYPNGQSLRVLIIKIILGICFRLDLRLQTSSINFAIEITSRSLKASRQRGVAKYEAMSRRHRGMSVFGVPKLQHGSIHTGPEMIVLSPAPISGRLCGRTCLSAPIMLSVRLLFVSSATQDRVWRIVCYTSFEFFWVFSVLTSQALWQSAFSLDSNKEWITCLN